MGAVLSGLSRVLSGLFALRSNPFALRTTTQRNPQPILPLRLRSYPEISFDGCCSIRGRECPRCLRVPHSVRNNRRRPRLARRGRSLCSHRRRIRVPGRGWRIQSSRRRVSPLRPSLRGAGHSRFRKLRISYTSPSAVRPFPGARTSPRYFPEPCPITQNTP